MAPSLLPPNPCLVAILLVANYHHQPRLVFHYPPKPGEDNSHFRTYLSDDLSNDESSSTSEDEGTSSDDNLSSADQRNKDEKGRSIDIGDVDIEELGSASPEKLDGMAQMRKPLKWNDIFGIEAVSLAKLLSPAPAIHKRRFEMSLDEKAFLGWPVFSKDGRWQKRKGRKTRSRNFSLRDDSIEKSSQRDLLGEISSFANTELEDTSGQETEGDDQIRHEIGNEKALATLPMGKARSGKTSDESHTPMRSSDEDNLPDTLKMFHVVFVLDPPPLEYHLRMKEMYDHVVKKFSRALRYEQARSNYVSKETSTISAAKRVGKSLNSNQSVASIYHQVLSQSSLAKAISTLFHSISDSKIAHINLTPTLSLSLQIPIPTSTRILPSPIAPQLPGLWLTTASSLPTDDDIDTTTSPLASHFTLLLLADLSTILTDVNATASPLTEPLTHYLRVSKPTKSFLQISQTSGIALRDIQFLASHLVYWRRARAIPPLSQRDTYIVSPNADMQKLSSATASFGKRFPTLPPLPRTLNMLSYVPRAYSTMIPSKEHKEAYMEILAWLLRDGWVTQLRTFAWIRVPGHIRERVLAETTKVEESVKSDPTSILTTSPLPSPPSPTSSYKNTTIITPPFKPSLIPNPGDASGLQSRYLTAISSFILDKQGSERQSAWEKCGRYFDGRHALETIAVREGWKRKTVADLMAGWEELGILLRARHW